MLGSTPQDSNITGLQNRTDAYSYILKLTFKTHAIASKKLLYVYISLVRAQLTYCSQLWRPHLLKDITLLEGVQCRAIKFILNDYQLSYRSRLLTLHLGTYFCYQIPSSSFNIYNFIESSSRLSHANKLIHHRSSNSITQHFFLESPVCGISCQ